jgi:hypothetical protein
MRHFFSTFANSLTLQKKTLHTSLILVVDHKAISLIVISFSNLKHNDNTRGHVISYNL